MTKTEKLDKIEETTKAINKKFGTGTIMRYSDKPEVDSVPIPTGVPSLDIALGIGGLMRGRVVEIYGPESSGKTTLTLHVAAECQKAGGTVAFIDVEHALDPIYAANLGVNMDDVLISQPDSAEDALEIVETLVRSEQVDLVVVDSVAALVPRAEIDAEMGASLPGLQARLMSQALRKITAPNSKTNTVIIFINQLRDKIGVVYGSPEVTTGGKALKFYASVRMDIRRVASIKEGDRVIGNRTRIKIVKNKMFPPFKETEVDLMYGEGISKESSLIELALAKEVIKKSGAWYQYKEESVQGAEKLKIMLKEKPELYQEILDKVNEK